MPVSSSLTENTGLQGLAFVQSPRSVAPVARHASASPPGAARTRARCPFSFQSFMPMAASTGFEVTPYVDAAGGALSRRRDGSPPKLNASSPATQTCSGRRKYAVALVEVSLRLALTRSLPPQPGGSLSQVFPPAEEGQTWEGGAPADSFSLPYQACAGEDAKTPAWSFPGAL